MTVSRVLNDTGNVWPGILSMIRACNPCKHSTCHGDGLLFACIECVGDGLEGGTAKTAADPKTREWWDIMMLRQKPFESRSDGEWWAKMDEVFHTDREALGTMERSASCLQPPQSFAVHRDLSEGDAQETAPACQT